MTEGTPTVRRGAKTASGEGQAYWFFGRLGGRGIRPASKA